MNYIQKVSIPLFLYLLPTLYLANGYDELAISATNKLSFERPNETIELSKTQLNPMGDVALNKIHVKDEGGREILCQVVDTDGDDEPDGIIFQANFAANQTRHFKVYVGKRHLYAVEQYKAYGRFVRERLDDFAWENDRIAHRTYGPALETGNGGPLTSSTIDVWAKRTKDLVINDWYMQHHYHTDTGEGADLYSAGKSRGVGGDGLWDNGKLWVSKNFNKSHVFENGPIRVRFKLTYNSFDVNGKSVKESKQVTLDAGHNLNHYEISYNPNKSRELVAGIGIQKTDLSQEEVHKGVSEIDGTRAIERSPGAFTQKDINKKRGWITTKQPVSKGQLYAAIIVSPQIFKKVTQDENNKLVLVKVPSDNNISYWAGYCWSRSGQFSNYDEWKTYISHFAQGLQSPIQIKVSP